MQRIIRDSWLATLMIVVVTVGMATSTGGRGNATLTASGLMQKLLKNYDKKVSPAELTGEPTTVNISLYVLRGQVDFKTWTISSIVYFRQSWFDKRLQFDEPNVAMKIFQLNDDDCDKVRLPDTFLSQEVSRAGAGHRFWKADPSGKVLYSQRMYITSTVYGTGAGYAYNVPFTFESFAYTTDSIVLKPMDNALGLGSDAAFSHRIISKDTADCTTTHTSGTYPCVRMSFYLSRNDDAYGRKQLFVLAPVTLLVAVLSSTASWLSPSSTGGLVTRVLIGLVTSVLSIFIIVMRDGYADQFGIPSIASDVLITGSVLVAVVAFLESVTVIVLASTKVTEVEKQDGNEATQSQWSDKLRRIDFAAKIVIPSAFVVFAIVCVIVRFILY